MKNRKGFTGLVRTCITLLACSLVLVTSCGGGSSGPRNISSPAPNPSDPSIGISTIDSFDQNAAVPISQTESAYIISSGGVDFFLDKNTLSLSALQGDETVIDSLAATVQMNGHTLSAGPPLESTSGGNWVEFRGWFSRTENLWYTARYRFWPDSPYVHLAFSITDRHDNHPTEAHWEDRWKNRIIQDFSIAVTTGKPLGSSHVVQDSAFSGGDPAADPRIEEQVQFSEVRWRQVGRKDGQIQLVHDADPEGKTWLRLYPRQSGRFELRLTQEPLFSPYPAANAVAVNVVHAEGSKTVRVDQGGSKNRLGSYTLNDNSYIQINAVGESGDKIVFEALELTSADGSQSRITAKRIADVMPVSGPAGFVVKDFWQKFPIEAVSREKSFRLTAIREPVKLVGGVGLTLDLGINADPANASNTELLGFLQNPPNPSLPQWWSSLDGVYTEETGYTALMTKSPAVIRANDEISGNYGWMNWGDYQIGHSYFIDGEPAEDWGALQYDLAHGLLMAWLQTGDIYLWNRARAAVRNAMDVQIAKFEPYFQKRSGAGLRKGLCTVDFHWCQENIPEFNYHTRALLLYSHLTGETWPRDIAQMVIDNSAYFSLTRTDWTLDHERILAWSLRNLVYGAEVFPQGTKYNESPEGNYPVMASGTSYVTLLNRLVKRVVAEIERNGRVPGEQPVWAGQIIEGLIIAFESGHLESTLADRTYQAIKTGISHFTEKELRSSFGEYEMLYYTPDNDWVDGANYGWFWVNSLAWASLNIDADYGEDFRDMYRWLQKLYEHDPEFQTTRAWTGVMGFPSYAASLYSNR